MPVALENVCTTALVAECAVGGAFGRHNVVRFSVGTGIGGAIAQNGQPVHGRATAGQFGHTSDRCSITLRACAAPARIGRIGQGEFGSSATAPVAEKGLTL